MRRNTLLAFLYGCETWCCFRGRTQIGGVWGRVTEENIRTWDGRCDMILDTIMRSFVAYSTHSMKHWRTIGGWDWRKCSTHGGNENAFIILVTKREGRRSLGKQRIKWIIILKSIFKYDCSVWIGSE